MLTKCVVDGTHGKPVFLFEKNNTGIYKCGVCGSVMADVTEDTLADAFDDLYNSGDYYTISNKDAAELDRIWGCRWRYILKEITQFASSGKLLDVGAGNGYLVYLASREFGFDAIGLEPSESQTEFACEALGVDVRAEMLEDHSVHDYSVVTIFNAIEHILDLGLFLNRVYDRLVPGGLIVVSTPNPGCAAARVRGLSKWCIIGPPHHINIFGRAGLHSLLSHAGFEVVHYETLSSYIHFLGHGVGGETLRKLIGSTLRVLRLGGDHLIIARKR